MTLHLQQHQLSSPFDSYASGTMSATATASSWKSPSHSHSHSHSRSSRPSTTPRAHPNPSSVGQAKPPLLTPKAQSPQTMRDPKSPSPSYFGFVVGGDDSIPPDSNPGHYARQNWNFPGSEQSSVPTPRHVPNESNPDYEAFRRQSESKGFSLNQSLSGLSRPAQSRTSSATTPLARPNVESPLSPRAKKPLLARSMKSTDASGADMLHRDQPSFFDIPRQSSPKPMTPKHNVADHQHARLSLPANELHPPAVNSPRKNQRSETLPTASDQGSPFMISPPAIAELLDAGKSVLILDLRVYQQYATARIRDALNLCIPTTLLKRPSFTVQKLADTFASDHDRERFDKWRDCDCILVYDANSSQLKEAVTPVNVLKKFASEGWTGMGLVVKGGFLGLSRLVPELVEKGPVSSGKGASTQPLSIAPPAQDAVPVAGGCAMPMTKSAANPFFGNIRQNMDLLDGVGQVPIKKPAHMSEESEKGLPNWLQQASTTSDEGKIVSGRFLTIEKSEQKRMQEALSASVSYGTPSREHPNRIQVAGIEKGSKNRYNNIYPYDHSRVRLQNVSNGDCDYVNANFVQAEYSNRRYIATQAPIPATFNDFWRVVWEQDVRVIVMLTAEAEGGQVKSHTYWNAGEYGPLKLKKLSERQVSLELRGSKAESLPAMKRPSVGPRRSTTNTNVGERKASEAAAPPATDAPAVTVRHFSLSHSSFPFQPMREITQLQYTQWPDFGAPASPTAILGLIEQVNKYIRGSSTPSGGALTQEAAPRGQRPIVVHCSAGCGRTGTFCTIDSVIDMLKRQRQERSHDDDDEMEVDSPDDWVNRDDVDLVAKTVGDFRHQRLSMVQNLRQFVLCYESVLQWVVAQQGKSEHGGAEGIRRSYQG